MKQLNEITVMVRLLTEAHDCKYQAENINIQRNMTYLGLRMVYNMKDYNANNHTIPQ